MNWRPDNWENPYLDRTSFVAQREAFEVGADAMLEALEYWGNGHWLRLDIDIDGNIVVFLEADREV